MQGQQQHMPLLAQADQADPQQRPLAQVERLQRLALRLLAQAGFLLGLGQAAAILEGNLQRALQGACARLSSAPRGNTVRRVS